MFIIHYYHCDSMRELGTASVMVRVAHVSPLQKRWWSLKENSKTAFIYLKTKKKNLKIKIIIFLIKILFTSVGRSMFSCA